MPYKIHWVLYMACQVAQCRHPETHITPYHKCGRCGSYGHGRVECPIKAPKDPLDKYFETGTGTGIGPEIIAIGNPVLDRLDALPIIALDPTRYCRVPGCPVPQTHASEAHQLDFDRYATARGPDKYGIGRRCDEGERQARARVEQKPGTYCAVYWGMGKFIVARNVRNVIDVLRTEPGPEMSLFCAGLREVLDK